MRKSIIIMAMAGLLTLPFTAQAEQAQGFGTSIMLGANMCIEQGDSSCSGVDPSFGMTLGGVYRTSEYFGWTMDFTLGLYDTAAGDVQSLGLYGGGKFFIPIGNLAIFAGAALGWGQWSVEGGGSSFEDNHLALAFQAGAEFYIFDNLAAGAWFRYQMPVFGEEHGSDRIDFEDYAHQVIVGAGGTYYF